MADIATLGIKVTTQGVKEAGQQLDGLDNASKKLSKTAAGPNGVAQSMDKTAMSAKQLAQASGDLSARVGSLAAKLALGQRPISEMVLQGRNLTQSFGGVGPALRAVGQYALALVNPVLLAAGAVAGLGVAWIKAEKEGEAFNRALIMTGNTANLTAGDLEAMAGTLDKTTSATAGKAAAVLAQVVESGRFTAQQFEMVSRAAIQMEEATGRAILETVKDFASLADAPTDAILKLNELGAVQNFLTAETLEAIKTLEDQGRAADATAVAAKALADTINSRTPEVVSNLSAISTVWKNIGHFAREAGDEFVEAFRKSDEWAKKGLVSLQKYLSAYSPLRAGLTMLLGPPEGPFANVKSQVTGPGKGIVDSRQARAGIEFEREALRYATDRARMEKEIADARALGLKAGKSELEIEKRVQQIRDFYKRKEPKGPKARKVSTTAMENAQERFADMLGRIRAELDGPLQRAEEEHLRRVREITQAAEKGKVGHTALAEALALEARAYAKATEEIKANLQSQVAALSGPTATAQDDYKRRLAEIDTLQTQLGLSGEQVNRMLEEAAKQYGHAAREAARAEDPIGALLSDMAAEIGMIGKSISERYVLNALRREGIDLASEEAQSALATARALEEEARAREQQIDLMDDFRSGASSALADFVTGAKSAKDALKDFFDELAAQITKAIANKWIEQLFGAQGTNGGGTAGGGWLASALGALFGGKNANGNAFLNGHVQAFAAGGIVNQPTLFGMSGGRLGLMGEAGAEAILPLHRGPDGKLGVRMEAANDGPVRSMVNNTTFVLPHLITPQSQAQMAQRQQQVQRRAMARN